MSIGSFFIINTVVVAVLVIFFVYKRKPKSPAKLKMKTYRSLGGENQNIYKFNKKTDSDGLRSKQKVGPRELNVYFNYNSETWEAYEVLGLPAGSSYESVKKAYLAQEAKGEVREVYKKAYGVLKKRLEK